MAKIHWIGAGNIKGWQRTACGLDGQASRSKDEYDGWDGLHFAAKYRDWNGVTCGRCLKNPHSPKGKFAAQKTSEPA